jgi:hypothetical protein
VNECVKENKKEWIRCKSSIYGKIEKNGKGFVIRHPNVVETDGNMNG